MGAIFIACVIAGQIAGVIVGAIFITGQIAPIITPEITANFAPGGFRTFMLLRHTKPKFFRIAYKAFNPE